MFYLFIVFFSFEKVTLSIASPFHFLALGVSEGKTGEFKPHNVLVISEIRENLTLFSMIISYERS